MGQGIFRRKYRQEFGPCAPGQIRGGRRGYEEKWLDILCVIPV